MTSNPASLAYCSAVFESKGTVYLSSGSKRTPKPRITVQITEKDPLTAMAESFGGTVRQRTKQSDKTADQKPVLVWEIEGHRAVDALKEMAPFFRVARNREIAELLETYPFKDGGGRTSKEEMRRRQYEVDKIARRLKKVNKKVATPRLGRRALIDPTQDDYDYLAGFFDTRGWLRPPESKENGTSVSETWHQDPDLIRHLWSCFGGKVYTHKAKTGRKASYSWRMSVTPARSVMPNVLPKMRVERRRTLLEHWSNHRPMPAPKTTDDVGVPSRWANMFN